jgi:hypothetical protein
MRSITQRGNIVKVSYLSWKIVREKYPMEDIPEVHAVPGIIFTYISITSKTMHEASKNTDYSR